MSYTLMFLPPVDDRRRRWAEALGEEVPEIEILLPGSREEALERIGEVRGAFGTLDPELLAAARELTWLCAPAAGPGPGFYFAELIDSDVTVTNQRGIYSDHISAHIMAFVLAFARGLHLYMPEQLQGVWISAGEAAPTVHLPEATAVLIGAGGIGGETARHLAHFGMHVIAIDPRVPGPPEGVHELHRPEALDEQIGRGDFVILTAPQTPAMEGLMNAERLARMKPTGVLINIGRGVNVVLDDLADALYDGHHRRRRAGRLRDRAAARGPPAVEGAQLPDDAPRGRRRPLPRGPAPAAAHRELPAAARRRRAGQRGGQEELVLGRGPEPGARVSPRRWAGCPRSAASRGSSPAAGPPTPSTRPPGSSRRVRTARRRGGGPGRRR